MLKILAGDLSAIFNIDGVHLDLYLNRKELVVQSICDQLLLHEQILIPTQDYLTASGLVQILGEHNFIKLLEEERIRFLRMRGFFGYVRGTGPDGRLLALSADQSHPTSSQIDQSIDAGLAQIKGQYKEHKLLKKLLIEQTHEIELQKLVDETHKDTYADLSQTPLWKDQYKFPNPDLIALPGLGKMGIKVIGPSSDINKNIIDTCLAIGLMNIELYLAKEFDCVSSSTGSPIGDCISFKLPRLTNNYDTNIKLWNFFEVAGIPDISGALLEDKTKLESYIKLTKSNDAEAFKQWFHSKKDLTEKEILKEYIEILQQTSWGQTKLGRTLRMVASLVPGAYGCEFLVDAGMSAVDSFVVEKIRKKGAKFFIADLKKFSNQIN
jgi:hypothetical protein